MVSCMKLTGNKNPIFLPILSSLLCKAIYLTTCFSRVTRLLQEHPSSISSNATSRYYEYRPVCYSKWKWLEFIPLAPSPPPKFKEASKTPPVRKKPGSWFLLTASLAISSLHLAAPYSTASQPKPRQQPGAPNPQGQTEAHTKNPGVRARSHCIAVGGVQRTIVSDLPPAQQPSTSQLHADGTPPLGRVCPLLFRISCYTTSQHT